MGHDVLKDEGSFLALKFQSFKTLEVSKLLWSVRIDKTHVSGVSKQYEF